jgi:hypothetical protein
VIADGLERFAPLTGVLTVGALVVVFSISGDAPDSDATLGEIRSYYRENDHREQLS